MRILVLDDEPSLRTFLRRALTGLGYDPVVASDGEEALTSARDGTFAAILCDQRMPGMSGVQVFRAMAEDDPDLARRFVMMSGDTLDAELAAFVTTNAVAVLAKPFDLDMLERVLEEVVTAGNGVGGQDRG